ncbi:MAG TPA: imidazole glycerol phosphate synthase subunit HisH, partial [Humisphaera sp.]|nr:imidazole glycerol phosphate synthase subunit HisH [Humisphaera sp.]
MSIAIVDYGMANLRSVQKAFEHVGHGAEIISRPEQIDHADKLVLPGVGAFADAVVTLREHGLAEPILRHIEKGKPFFGICLGLQMLFEVGYEDGVHQGLGLFKGTCIRFDVDEKQGLKVPHMGWNQLQMRRPAPIFRDLPIDCGVYFVHGYHVVP